MATTYLLHLSWIALLSPNVKLPKQHEVALFLCDLSFQKNPLRPIHAHLSQCMIPRMKMLRSFRFRGQRDMCALTLQQHPGAALGRAEIF